MLHHSRRHKSRRLRPPKLDAEGHRLDGLYRYRQLKQQDTIRLLKLAPYGKLRQTKLEGTLYEVRLSNHPRYEAVSYTWGTEDPDEIIGIAHGSHLKITTNLANALRRFRYPLRPRWLWIDALCINQGDDTEKSSQLRLMSVIYSKSVEVLIWLGLETSDIARQMSFLKELNEYVSVDDIWVEYLIPLWRSPSKSMRAVIARLRREYFEIDSWEEFDDRKYSLFERLWFTRRWVLQEVALARYATAFCGQHKIGWHALALAVSIIYVECTDWAYFLSRAAKVVTIWSHIYLSSLMEEPQLLFNVLDDFESFNCKDDRDRLFSIYGLVQSKSLPLTIDYKRTVVETYMIFAREWLDAAKDQTRKPSFRSGSERWSDPHGPLQFLEMAGSLRTRHHHILTDLPSWVPDWREIDRHSGLSLARSHSIPSLPLYRLGANLNELLVSGYLVDVIDFAGDNDELIPNFFLDGSGHAPSSLHDCTPQRQHQLHDNWSRLITRKYHPDDRYKPSSEEKIWQVVAKVLIAHESTETMPSHSISGLYTRWCRDWLTADWTREQATQKLMGRSVFEVQTDVTHYALLVSWHTCGRTPFITRTGHIGMGPSQLREGDHVVALLGGRKPYLLRPVEGGFQFVGPAYVYGYMDEDMEALMSSDHSFEQQEFMLI